MSISLSQNYFTQRRRPLGPESASPSSGEKRPTANSFREQLERFSGTNPLAAAQGRRSRPISALSPASTPSGEELEQRTGMRYFHSRRIRKDQVVKPWTKEPRDPKEKWVTIIPLIGLIMGLCAAGFIIWDGIRSVVNHKYCMVLDEDWAQGFRPDIWQAEIRAGGFGYDSHFLLDQFS